MEGNNMKAMREEVSALLAWAESNLRLSPDLLKEGTRECCEFVVACCKSALAAPPRQCDVGTAEEQNKRLCSDFFSVRQCGSFTRTALEWGQMPYEEGETDGSK